MTNPESGVRVESAGSESREVETVSLSRSAPDTKASRGHLRSNPETQKNSQGDLLFLKLKRSLKVDVFRNS